MHVSEQISILRNIDRNLIKPHQIQIALSISVLICYITFKHTICHEKRFRILFVDSITSKEVFAI
jgi:hypothetical protein